MGRRKCCCGCPCSADAARADQEAQSGILISDKSASGYFDGATAVFAYYSDGKWFFNYFSGPPYYRGAQIIFECRDDRWYASGFFYDGTAYGAGCYYSFDEPVCPTPPPRVDSNGYFGGAFVVSNIFTKVANVGAWMPLTDYGEGDKVMPSVTNGFWYYVSTDNGGSGETEPVWPTVDEDTVADGGLIWTAVAHTCALTYADEIGMTFVPPA